MSRRGEEGGKRARGRREERTGRGARLCAPCRGRRERGWCGCVWESVGGGACAAGGCVGEERVECAQGGCVCEERRSEEAWRE